MSDWERIDVPAESDVEVLTRLAMLQGGCVDAPELTAFSVYITGRDGQELSMRVLNIVNLADLIKTLAPRSLTIICAEGEDGRELKSQVYALVRNDDMATSRPN